MVNPVANAQGDPNSATPQAMGALAKSAAAPTLANGAASTTSTALVTLAGAMIVPVAAVTGFAVGNAVQFGGYHWTVTAVGPGNQLTMRYYFGAGPWPPGTTVASASQVMQRV